MTKSGLPRDKSKPRTQRAAVKTGSIAIKRVYDRAVAGDGVRIVVDRLWPRGLSKAGLKFDAWPPGLAPSTELRKWYRHDPKRFAEFRRRYRDELAANAEALTALRLMIKGRAATLLTAVRELDMSHATVLREILIRKRP
jgi:uncharacterized protein YeaO (DUF488 family)